MDNDCWIILLSIQEKCPTTNERLNHYRNFVIQVDQQILKKYEAMKLMFSYLYDHNISLEITTEKFIVTLKNCHRFQYWQLMKKELRNHSGVLPNGLLF